MIVTTLLGFAAVFTVNVAKAQPPALLFVDPQNNIFQPPTMNVGSTFLVNVSVANMTNIAGMQFQLSWDHNLLKCNSMADVFFSDPLITLPADIPSNINVIKKTFNNTAGTATYGITWTDGGLAASEGYEPANITTTGSAVGIPSYSWPQGKHGVAAFNFTVLQAPNSTVPSLSSALHISNDILGDLNGLPISHTDVDGLYKNSITITGPYFSMATQGSGASGSNYTAHSVGEIFNVTVSVNNLDAALKAVGFQFILGYNSSLLQVLSVSEGPWLPPFGVSPDQGTTFYQRLGFNATINQDFVAVGDLVEPDVNATWHEPFPSGTGVIAIITFNATLQSPRGGSDLTCPLTPFDTIIADTSAAVLPQSQAPVSGTYIVKSKSIPGDLDHDGKVDILDAIIAAKAFGSHPGSANWNPDADLNGDGTINILDIILLANNFGRTS
jgi:hypothetical protein